MSEFIGAFGRTTEIKPIKTQGVTRIVIEIPIEHHVQATAAFYDKDVIVTLGKNEDGRYGVFKPDSEPEKKEPEPKKPSFFKELFRLGWFNNPRVLKAFGSDIDYQDYIRTQPSCVSGACPVEFAHVRRIENGSGMGIKPEYSGVPLTHEEHMQQHNEGESALGGREFFDKQLVKYRQAWIKSVIYEHFGVSSLSDIDLGEFYAYLISLCVEDTVPVSAMGMIE